MSEIVISSNLKTAILQVWNAIAPDCEGLFDTHDNEAAVEMCYDADRLVLTAENQAAQEELTSLIQAHGYIETLSALSSKINLV